VPRKASPRPPAGKPARKPKPRSARAADAAAGLIAGKSQAEIGREQGISRQAVHQVAGEARQLICALVDAHQAALESTFLGVLEVIQDALGADRVEKSTTTTLTEYKGKKTKRIETAPFTLGPDHYARLTAAKRFIELLTAGRPMPKAPESEAGRGPVTWADLVALVKAKNLQ
jgi:hypothetical protein